MLSRASLTRPVFKTLAQFKNAHSSQRLFVRTYSSCSSTFKTSSALSSPLRQNASRLSRRTVCLSSHSLTSDMADTVPGGPPAESGKGSEDSRLPTNVVPRIKHYDIVIKTDLEAKPPFFSGESVVTLDVQNDTTNLVFNIHKQLKITHIAITSTELKTTPSQSISLEKLSFNEEQEKGTLDLSGISGGGLKAGSNGVKVWFRFESILRGSMQGYYLSEGDADEKTGKKPVYALTQMEAVSARAAFPCWDEPLLKTTYAVSLIAREKDTVLNNMPEVSSKPWKASSASPESALSEGYELGSLIGESTSSGKTEGQAEFSSSRGDWKITKFDTTPLMSSYLVAWACGDFASLSSEHKSKLTGKTIPLRIFATPNQIKQAQFALDIKKWALPVYEEIFDIPYALPKLDTLVAHDFDAGAMENWGLITGRTTAYLFDPEKSSLAAKKRVAVVQCHELAHMWFGDIVTMKWWDNLWLNEAFATLMGELVILDRVWPEWKARQDFLNTHLSSALALDSQRSSHPIEVECPNAEYINQIFDSISYSKGAAVLRMLAGVVGEDKFLKGVSIYLKKHLYGSAETKDLWEGISEASGLDVAKIMANWTLKVGFPVITVEELGDRKIKVTQNRFLSTGDAKPEEDETLWYVPLEIKSFTGEKATIDHSAVLDERAKVFDVGSVEDYKLNADTVGVYRVHYSPERLVKLGKKAASFTVEDRVGLVSDAATLARAGFAKTSDSLSLIKEVGKTEGDYLPWAQIGGALARIDATWWEQPKEVRKAVDKLRTELFRPIVNKMGYEHGADDAPDVKELRELAVSAAAASEDPGVLAELKKRFQPFLESGDDSKIPPDLQRTIYTNATRHGGLQEYEKMLEVYNKPANPSSQVDAMYALCSTREPDLLDRSMKMITDGSVKDQNVYIFFFGLGANTHSRRKVTEWFKENLDSLAERFRGSSSGMRYFVKGTFATLTSHKDLKMAKEFFKDKDIRSYRLGVEQAYDSIQAAADWLERDKKDVEQWLKENKYL